MKASFPLRRKLFLSHFLATLVVSATVGTYLYLNARESIMNQLRTRLSSTAAIVSRDLDADELRDVRYASDVTKPEYKRTLKKLRSREATNRDIAFLYIMRRDDSGKVYFVVDSDRTKEQARPGREYQQLNDRLVEGFTRPVADDSYTSDEWGTFISGYAPIMNSNGEFMLGIDMRADDARAKLSGIRRSGLFGVIGGLVLSWAVATWMSRHFRRPIEAMIAQCEAVGSGDFDRRLEMRRFDEMDSLIGAINDMTADLRKSRDENIRLAESLDDAISREE